MPFCRFHFLTVIALVLIGCSSSSSESANDIESDNLSAPSDVAIVAPKQPEFLARPKMLANLLDDSSLKTTLANCNVSSVEPSALSISHRGAPFQFPEHSREGYIAAAEQGAGAIECDVTFTNDKELVCRHSQCDLHTTTNILDTELASLCSRPPELNSPAPFSNVQCCTSNISLAQFKTLKAKRDGGDKSAATVQGFFAGTPGWSAGDEVDSDSNFAEVMSHKESIALLKSLGVAMVPELKAPQVSMPFDGTYTQSMYASQMLDEYSSAGVEANRVFPQSFNLEDIQYWIQSHPDFGQQAVYLDGRYRDALFSINDELSWSPSMDEMVSMGVQYLASPTWMLLTLDAQNNIVSSQYAKSASDAGLKLIAWTIERSGSITSGNNWYYQSINAAVSSEGDVFNVIDVLTNDVGVVGIFSDWPATTSYYANCVI